MSDASTRLNTALEGLDQAGIPNYEGLRVEAADRRQVITDLRDRLSEFVAHPKDDGIYWVTDDGRSGDLSMHTAPLHVGECLRKLLFADKESVILTSATLATNDTFDHIRERTGFADTHDLLLGSPFDYPKAAMLCVPEDMPEPRTLRSSWREMLATWRRQEIDPAYQFDTPLPATARQFQTDTPGDLENSTGELAAKDLR